MIHNTIKIAITLPGFSPIPSPIPSLKPEFTNVASVLSGLLEIALYISIFLAFYYLIWGTYQYILARGDKEGLAKARERIKWALIGLVVVFMAFLIARYAGGVFPATRGGLPF